MVQLAGALDLGSVTLRAHRDDDLDALAELFGTESITRYLYWGVRTREETREQLRRRMAQPVEVSDENILFAAVARTEDDHVIGDFLLHWHENEHRQGEVGGTLLPAHHGQGIAPLVYRELVRLGFERYGLHRIVGRCDARNAASIRSLEKVGMRREAHFVENEFVKGEWTDEIILALRRDEWSERGES